jgi:hypothetical protein
MKIKKVETNNRKKCFEVHTARRVYPFPYGLAEPAPDREKRVERVFVDPELGREAFTYELASGEEGSVHIDSVLEYNEDPKHMADLLLYRLTLKAETLLEESPLGVREVIRRLGTSASQFYRLMDPTNSRKSLRQMIELLYVLGYEVEVELTSRRASA